MWKKIVLGIVVLIAGTTVLVLYLTAGMSETAENFFEEVKAHRYDKAYGMLSEDFRQSTSREELIRFLKQAGLDQYQSASWGNRSMEGRRGVLEGTVTTSSGTAVPLTIRFVKYGDGNWQIYEIEKPKAGAHIVDGGATSTAASTTAMPDTETSKALVRETIGRFARSVNKGEMSELRDSAAEIFRQEVSLERINQALQPFIKMGIDFTVLDRMDPRLEPGPEMDEKGVLTLQGYYDTKPNRFHYTLRYIREKGEWKLVDFNVAIR